MSKSIGQKLGIKFTEIIANKESAIILPNNPVIRGHTTQTGYGSSTVVNIPEEAAIGDLLLMFWAKDDDPIESVADGWTRIWTSYDTYHRVSVHYKFYDGEGKQFTLTHDSEETSAIVFSIQYVDVPVVSSVYRGTTQTPTPPPLTTGFEEGSPTLWFAFAGCDYQDVTGFPSNFPDNNVTSNRSGVGLGVASLYSTNQTETPESFTLSGSEETSAGTLAVTFRTKKAIFEDFMRAGFTVSGEEYQYVNGPLISKEYEVSSVGKHPDYSDDKHLLVTMHPQSRFNNVEGPLTIQYDQSQGSLRGRGGPVEGFTETFTPTDLEPKPNPGVAENIEVSAEANVDFIKVTYRQAYADEQLIVSASATVDFIYVGVINP
jgi:hypothetical protein